MQIGAYAEPWYFSVVFNRPINRLIWRHSLSPRKQFSLAMAACDENAGHFGAEVIAGISNSKVGFLPFQKGYYYPCSERLSVVHFNFRDLSNLFFLWHRQKSTFGINKPLLGRIKSTRCKMYAVLREVVCLGWCGLVCYVIKTSPSLAEVLGISHTFD